MTEVDRYRVELAVAARLAFPPDVKVIVERHLGRYLVRAEKWSYGLNRLVWLNGEVRPEPMQHLDMDMTYAAAAFRRGEEMAIAKELEARSGSKLILPSDARVAPARRRA